MHHPSVTEGQFTFATEPFEHQLEGWRASRDLERYALFWEQGTGKSKLVIDTAAWLWGNGKIDAVLIVAPNGVHTNWILDEVPTHLGDFGDAKAEATLFAWRTAKAGTREHKRVTHALVNEEPFPWVALSYDAVMTEAGRRFVWDLLRRRRCLYVLDEAHYVKTPGAKRTKRIVASGAYAPYKRILTGTPVANSPFDLFTQLQFLDADFWRDRSIRTFQVFKHRYGEIATGFNGRTGKEYKYIKSYRRLGELNRVVDEVGSRVLKADVLDLPPKLHSKRYFDLTREQQRIYDELKEEYRATLESGERVTATMAITRLLRFQQITCGYVPADEDEPDDPTRVIPGKNPRLECAMELLEELPHPAIVWARFRHDIDMLCDRLGHLAARYDGAVGEDDRERAKRAFQGGDVQFFVANAQVGSTGLTLTAAQTVVYYSNTFKLTDRLQSEDRAHRIGQEHPVNYIDIVAPGTVDTRIVAALRKKRDIASRITGDELLDWL